MIESNPPKFSIRARFRSFRYAFRGMYTLCKSEPNARVHAAATIAVIVVGVFAGVDRIEWCLLIFSIVAVWATEALNTAIEMCCDVASPTFHPLVEKAKDVAAASVLICAIGAAIVGGLVLGPPVLAWLTSMA